ncbi:Flp pilus assembly complex ATPase component TadA [Arenimonas sp.]|nr:Flp pilus assembly complex ATPase component TadA [Candidatus Parcubacteria bacterium]
MHIDQDQLYKFIIDSGLITKEEYEVLKKKAEEKGESLQNTLMSSGKITEDDFLRIQAYLVGIPFVDLSKTKVQIDTLALIPEPIARKHNIVAYSKKDDYLEVALMDGNDLNAIDFIKKKTGLRVLPRLTNSASIKNLLLQYQKSLKADFGDIIQKEASNLKLINSDSDEINSDDIDDLKKMADDLPVIKIVETLLNHAAIQGVSDIHIEHGDANTIIRYRIDGLLHDAMILPKNSGPSITARIKVLANLKLDEKRLPQDGRFKIDLNGEKISFRVSVLPTYYGEKIVMRLLRENVSGFTLEGLGFHGQALEDMHNALNYSEGMILTTGPTGSGKTTTLYTMLDILNTPDVNISTVEDPIEYQIKRINQTQIRSDIGFTFASGLRSLLRQDPDIIMVGEIRDNETASLAINAALTGHLVLSTLHTNSAAGAVPRLMDMKCEPFLLVSTIKIIIAQRLVRKLSETKTKYFLSNDELVQLGKKIDLDRVLEFIRKENIIDNKLSWKEIPFYKANPVDENNDGFKGRIGIHEALKVTLTIKELVIKNATADTIQEQAKNDGMLTMLEDGIFQCVQGMTSIEEVLRVAND